MTTQTYFHSYKLGFNRAVKRASEECQRHGREKGYDLAMENEIQVTPFDPEDFSTRFPNSGLDEEEARDLYDHGVSVGLKFYFDFGVGSDWTFYAFNLDS